MPINWSLAPDGNFLAPLNAGYDRGRALAQQRDEQNILAKIGAGDQGAIQSLYRANPGLALQLQAGQRQQQTSDQAQADRQAKVAAAGLYAGGNTKGAIGALAPSGDLGTMTALQDQQAQMTKEQATALSTFATRVRPLATAQDGGVGLQAALTAFEPQLRAAGVDDEDMRALRDGLKTHPGEILTALADPAKLTEVSAGAQLVDPTTGKVAYTAPTKPDYLVVPQGGTATRIDPGAYQPPPETVGAPSGGAPSPQAGSAPLATVEGVLADVVPGAQITSEQRTPERNAAVGGVANSQHLDGTALDFVPPPGSSIDQVRQAFAARGIQLTEALNEGDHFHIAWGPKGAELRPGPGVTTARAPNGPPLTIQGPPKQETAPAGYRFKADGRTLEAIAGGPADPAVKAQGDDAPMDANTIQYWSQFVHDGGAMPAFGMGKAAAANRAAILSGVAKIGTAAGETGGDQLASVAGAKANSAALSRLTTTRALVQSYADTADQTGKLVLDLMSKADLTGQSPVINRWIRAGRKEIAGDPDVASFNNAVGTFADEYAKAITGGTSNNGSTEGARKEAYDRISKASTPQQMASIVATMQKEMGYRVSALQKQEDAQRASLSRNATPNAAAPKAGGAGWSIVGVK